MENITLSAGGNGDLHLRETIFNINCGIIMIDTVL